MTNITIWISEPCKSIMPTFRELGALPDTHVTLVVLGDLSRNRKTLGFKFVEPPNVDLINLIENRKWSRIDAILREHRDDIHIFTNYQRPNLQTSVIKRAIRLRIRYFVMSEAPVNLNRGVTRVLKAIYLDNVVPRLAKRIVANADGIFNLSGNSSCSLSQLGWSYPRIYPFGYFVDPVASCVDPTREQSTLRILCIGLLSKNKGVDLLLHALGKLQARGIDFECNITGVGPEYSNLMSLREELGLESRVHFLGVVDSSVLRELFNKSSVMVCPGYVESWGIRVNEAILAGLPVIASDRIGATDLIKASGSGRIFRSGDVGELAEYLSLYVLYRSALVMASVNACKMASKISPKSAARYVKRIVDADPSTSQRLVPSWNIGTADADEESGAVQEVDG